MATRTDFWQHDASRKTIANMVGMTLDEILGLKKGSESLIFRAANGEQFEFCHESDCCESVQIEDVCGDACDLIGSPLLIAEEVSNYETEAPKHDVDSYTWTFYRFATIKGTVTVRWLGESNGYYSEDVAFSYKGPSAA